MKEVFTMKLAWQAKCNPQPFSDTKTSVTCETKRTLWNSVQILPSFLLAGISEAWLTIKKVHRFPLLRSLCCILQGHEDPHPRCEASDHSRFSSYCQDLHYALRMLRLIQWATADISPQYWGTVFEHCAASAPERGFWPPTIPCNIIINAALKGKRIRFIYYRYPSPQIHKALTA